MANNAVSTLKIKYTSDVNKVTKDNEKLARSFRKVQEASKGTHKGLSALKTGLKACSNAVKNHTSAFEKLGAAVKRIAFYRAIRSAIKAVTQAMKEGVNNLYEYSAALNSIDASRAKNTMDALATSVLYIKNSLGAMLMPILQSLVPLVNTVADAFANAANAVNQFFHALKGEGTFTRAKKYVTEYDTGLKKAAGSAKELKKQVFGFDELNIFNEPSKGGGGGGSNLDYSKMFEEMPVADWISKLAQNAQWERLGGIFAEKLNAAIRDFDAEAWGTNLGKRIQKGVGIAFGFLEKFNFKQVGSKVAKALNGMMAAVKWDELGHIFLTKFTALFDFIVGFVNDFDTAELANALGSFVKGALNHFTEWIISVNWAEFGKTFFTKVYEFVTGIDYAGIARAFFTLFGAALGALWDFGASLIGELFVTIDAYFKKKTEECGGSSILGFLKGIADAVVGIFGWIVDNVWTPFWSGMCQAFGISGGISSKVKEAGTAVIDGFFAGLTGAWKKVADWLTQKANAVKNVFRSIVDGLKNFKGESPRLLDWGTPAGLYASGGQPPTGSLYWAGEAGPELVGQVGGKNTVTTYDQFTAGMEGIMDNTNTVILQAAQAVVQAIMSQDMTPIVQISDRAIVNAYDRGKRLGGTGLVTGSGIV